MSNATWLLLLLLRMMLGIIIIFIVIIIIRPSQQSSQGPLGIAKVLFPTFYKRLQTFLLPNVLNFVCY